MNEMSAIPTTQARTGRKKPANERTRVSQTLAKAAARKVQKSNDNQPPLPEDIYLEMLVQAFAERKPNALGHAAFFLDDKGFYRRAVSRPEYYLHAANRSLFARHSEAVANRVNGVRQAVIF